MASRNSNAARPFGVLSELLGQDRERVARVLRAFCLAAHEDLGHLDIATHEGNLARIKVIAYRTAMACHLVGEHHAGDRLDAIARSSALAALDDPAFERALMQARAALVDAMVRASRHTATVSSAE